MNDDDQDGDTTEFLGFTPQPTVVDNYIPINPTTDEQRENLFRSSFAFVDPYLNGPSAIDEPLETGQPAGSRNLGEIGEFLNRYTLNSPPTYTPEKEYHFFTVEMLAVASGQVEFWATWPKPTRRLCFPSWRRLVEHRGGSGQCRLRPGSQLPSGRPRSRSFALAEHVAVRCERRWPGHAPGCHHLD